LVDLVKELPQLLPLAVDWAESRLREILETGSPLTPKEQQLASSVSVRRPELVRIEIVTAIPVPGNPKLRAAAEQAGLLGPSTQGLTLGYGIYFVEGFIDDRVRRHECRHVYRYERAGLISAFLSKYVSDVLEFGYREAPDKIGARAWENGWGRRRSRGSAAVPPEGFARVIVNGLRKYMDDRRESVRVFTLATRQRGEWYY
jgi:hypothetical protein